MVCLVAVHTLPQLTLGKLWQLQNCGGQIVSHKVLKLAKKKLTL